MSTTESSLDAQFPEGEQQSISIRVGHLLEIAKKRMAQQLTWYKDLTESEKSTLNDIIRVALEDFLKWCAEYMKLSTQEHENGGSETGDRDALEQKVSTDHIFFIAPLEFTQSVNLQQTLQVTRLVVDVLESNIGIIASGREEPKIHQALLYYTREVAFSAASVYASAAEAQGAWDARLETLVIESLISNPEDSHLASRLAALGWKLDNPSFCIVGRLGNSGEISSGFVQDKLRNRLHQMGAECCMSMHGQAMVTLIGVKGDVDAKEMISNLVDLFNPSSNICVGPLRKGLEGVAATVRAAVNGFEAAPALPNLPRLFRSDGVLPERVLLGDSDAREDLYRRIYLTMKEQASDAMLETVDEYLETGSLEETARILGVHSNTVRYRLKRTVETTGWDPSNQRDAYVLLTALKIGRMEEVLEQSN